jgi:hypothetical protein
MVDRFKEGLQKMADEKVEQAKREADRAQRAAAGGEGGEAGSRADRIAEFRARMQQGGGGGGWGGRGGGARGTLRGDLERLGRGPARDKELSAEAIGNRRSILTSIKGTTSDPDFQAMFVSVEKRIDELASPTEGTSSRWNLSDPASARRDEERRNNRGGEGRTPGTTPRRPGGQGN